MMSHFAVIERASIDEAFMDLTAAVQQRLKSMADQRIEPELLKTTHVQGYPLLPDQEVAAEDTVSDKGGFLISLINKSMIYLSPRVLDL